MAPGGTKTRRMIHPNTGCSDAFFMGVATVEVGKSPHSWHKHVGVERGPGFCLEFPPGFEEAYIIIRGKGTVQWKVENRVMERQVDAGDAVFLPKGMGDHQLLNTGNEPMVLVFGGAPPM